MIHSAWESLSISLPHCQMSRLLFVLLCVGVAVLVAASGGGGPAQAEEDSTHWTLLPGGGISARPFISDLSVRTGASTFTAWTGVTTPAASPPAALAGTTGKLVAVVYAANMCSSGQTASCYSSPNRVAVVIAITNGGATSLDFNDTVCTDHTITEDSIFDITLDLNSLSASAGWTWVNGRLEYFSLIAGKLRIKAKLDMNTPSIDWALYPDTGCTATPIRDCDVARNTGYPSNTLNFFVSIDSTVTTFSGSAFASTGAILGFLNPGFADGSTINPTLQYTLSGPHLQPDDSLNVGFLRSVLPMQTVVTLFPEFTTQDPHGYFNISKVGTVTAVSASFSTWTVSGHGTSALVFDVSGVTFSAPTYQLDINAAFSSATVPSLLFVAMLVVSALVT